jgi:hypothetical protein
MANGFTPALLEFTGTEAPHKNAAIFAKRGIDWTPAVMTDPKYRGGGAHVPALTTDADHGETSLTKTLDGTGTVQLADVIRDWFKRELTGPQARTPVPEIDPGMRLVAGPTEVSLIVPSPSITVRYTTDGTEPTDQSPVYSRPFTVQPGTHVRAFATMAGRRPSRVCEAFFRTGPVPPAVTAPVALELPPATAGTPYSVQFTANTPNARWCVEGELRPRPSESKSNGTKTMYYPNGMLMDGKGRWSGTPTTPGVYWMQVWVNDGVGRIAGYRNYRWTVTGSPVGPQRPEEVLLGDTYKPLATLTGLNQDAIRELQDFFQGEGIRAVFQDAANSKVLLLVPASDSDNARRVLAGKAVAKEWTPEWEK